MMSSFNFSSGQDFAVSSASFIFWSSKDLMFLHLELSLPSDFSVLLFRKNFEKAQASVPNTAVAITASSTVFCFFCGVCAGELGFALFGVAGSINSLTLNSGGGFDCADVGAIGSESPDEELPCVGVGVTRRSAVPADGAAAVPVSAGVFLSAGAPTASAFLAALCISSAASANMGIIKKFIVRIIARRFVFIKKY